MSNCTIKDMARSLRPRSRYDTPTFSLSALPGSAPDRPCNGPRYHCCELTSFEPGTAIGEHMAAIRMLFDHLLTGAVLEHNPALSVKAPRQKLGKGKSPSADCRGGRRGNG